MQQQLDTLQERLKTVRQLQEENKWNEAAAQMLEIKDQALQVFQDELAPGMAEFYYRLGDVLTCKVEYAQDLFGQQVKEAEEGIKSDSESEVEEEEKNENKEDAQEEKAAEEPKQKDEGVIQDEPQEKDGDKQNGKTELQEELDGDYQLAYENLETARVILDREYQKIQENQFDNNKEQIIKRLARVYQRKAELEQWRDNFDVALQEHQRALNLRLEVDDKERSRDLAESYFLIGNVHSYNGKPGWEFHAMSNFKSALQILENILSEELNLPKRDISNVDSETPNTYHLGSSFLDTEKTKELKQVIKLIYEKIEDVKIGIKEQQSEEYQKLQKEFQELREKQTQQFSQPQIQNAPVIKLGSFGNAAKKLQQTTNEDKQEQQKGEPAKIVAKNNKENTDEIENYEVPPQKKIKED